MSPPFNCRRFTKCSDFSLIQLFSQTHCCAVNFVAGWYMHANNFMILENALGSFLGIILSHKTSNELSSNSTIRVYSTSFFT